MGEPEIMAQFTSKGNPSADIRTNTRAKLIKKLKDQIGSMTGELTREIQSLNSEASRPIHLVNDLAGKDTGKRYLDAPEHSGTENEWPIQLGRLLQDVKQLERRILRAELSASQRAA